mmetsp:Transcript_5957/g.13160  ORF Transcript_5957/g.13160 Transcript_5957/m.13160 type:complete len:329 (+) Transcript_5957:120-1106(+)
MRRLSGIVDIGRVRPFSTTRFTAVQTSSGIPTRLASQVVTLQNRRGQKVFLLGTAHVSQESCDDASDLIRSVRPPAVFLELCEQRRGVLHDEVKEESSLGDVLKKLKTGEANAFSVIYSYYLRSIADTLKVRPGGEFKAANDAATHVALTSPCSVVLGDRPVGITLNRLWMGLSPWQKVKLVWELMPSASFVFSDGSEMQTAIDQMKGNKDMLTAEVQRMGKKFPWIVECLINERDKFMVLELEMTLNELGQGDVVAVVGAGHLDGMEKQWVLLTDKGLTESFALHRFLQLCPDTGQGQGEGQERVTDYYSVEDLRAYAVRAVKDYPH